VGLQLEIERGAQRLEAMALGPLALLDIWPLLSSWRTGRKAHCGDMNPQSKDVIPLDGLRVGAHLPFQAQRCT
jgi:hypothetical protein